MDPDFAQRNVNEGFSGGEKKRHEIVQLELLNPKIAILDETDSGLDIDALKSSPTGVNRFRDAGRPGRPADHPLHADPALHQARLRARVRRPAGSPRRAARSWPTARGRGLRAVRARHAARRHDASTTATVDGSDRRWLRRRAGPGGLPDPVAAAGQRTPARLPRQREHLAEAAAGRRRASRTTTRTTTPTWPGRCTSSAPRRPRRTRAPATRSRPSSARPSATRSSSPRTPPRRSTWSRTPLGDVAGTERRPGRRGRHLRDGAPLQHRAVAAARASAPARRCAGSASPTTAGSTSATRRADQRAHQGRLASSASRTCWARSTRSPRSPRRAHAVGALVVVDASQAVPQLRSTSRARRRPRRVHRSQDGRPDRHRRALGPVRPARRRCRRSSVAAR